MRVGVKNSQNIDQKNQRNVPYFGLGHVTEMVYIRGGSYRSIITISTHYKPNLSVSDCMSKI